MRTRQDELELKLGIEQCNASLVAADGSTCRSSTIRKARTAKVRAGRSGVFYVIKPGAQPEILSHTALEGRCFGTPVAFNGKVYVQTTKHLYCFGKAGNNPGYKPARETLGAKSGAVPRATQLQIIPSEVLLHPVKPQRSAHAN